jgi:methyl-accepting chemotaxis protein
MALGNIQSNERNFLFGLLVSLVVCLTIAFIIAKFIGRSFIAESSKLTDSSVTSHQLSKVLFESSDSVASATVEQSAGIQESVSALSEMGSMISQTATSAKTSMDSAQKMNNKAKEGEHIMEEMMYSFRSIQEANQQLQKISSIIQEVSKKTNIINDIVFKTQLLSFNASIEAARAGQHGKGFAVVAEEVGNLAKVSGSAAKDIEMMLQDSQKQVQEILDSLHEKIEKSSTVSNQAVTNFKDISQEIEVIVSQIRGITDACAQQELGVQQTSTAMSQIDIATQKNSSTAQETLGAAKRLADENTKLKDISSSIYALINGGDFQANKVEHIPQKPQSGGDGNSVVNLEDSMKNLLTKRGSKDPKQTHKAS